MNHRGFAYNVLATITLTGPEMAAIRRAAFGHYDRVCRESAHIGGFQHGMATRTEFESGHRTPEDLTEYEGLPASEGGSRYEAYLTRLLDSLGDREFEFTLPFRQIDTMAKITEEPHRGAHHLHAPLVRVLRAINEESGRLHDSPQAKIGG